MKGNIFLAFKETIIKNFGEFKWKLIFSQTSFPKDFPLLKTEIYDDKYFFELLDIAKKELNVDIKFLFNAFAEYFLFTYTPKNLSYVVENVKNSRDIFVNLDLIHETLSLSSSLEDIPRFEYKETGKATAILIYKSKRKLYDLFHSMVLAVANHYKDCEVEHLDENKLLIRYKS